MKTTLFSIDTTKAPEDAWEPACQLVPAATAMPSDQTRSSPQQPRCIGRPDTLTAQRVEVGIVLNAMLGISAATEYLDKHAIAVEVMLRVLSPTGKRRGTHDESGVRTGT